MREETQELPITAVRETLIAQLTGGNRVIVVAPTGSGKTTQLPQYCLDGGLAEGRKVVVLQPRRVAARAVARRVCQERGVKLGTEVGYQVRFDDQTNDETRLIFMTEGVLMRQFQTPAALDEIGVLILDEFHERTLHSDVIIGLVKALQRSQRPDLKVVVMSATLDVSPLTKYLSGSGGQKCPVLEVAGRSYPVSIRYAERQDRRRVSERAAERVIEIARSTSEGDILVFMPGMGEINATIRELSDRRLGRDFVVLPLHGELPLEQQDRVFEQRPNRKVIVATNVAESSITIAGVWFVVDGGLARVARYDAATGLNGLEIEEISQAAADQRAGRAGRTAPGTCYRLWTESGQLNRLPQSTPEIQRTELSEVVLQLHALGIRRVDHFDWLDAPDKDAVAQAESLLDQLGAFDHGEGEKERLSAVGRKMLRLPMHTRFARMLIEGARRGCFAEGALCAALVSGRGLMVRGAKGDRASDEARAAFQEDERSDFFAFIKAFETVREGGFRMAECRHYGVNRQVALGVQQVYEQLRAMERQVDDAASRLKLEGESREDSVLKCLLAGFVDQVCQRLSLGTLECRIVGDRKGTLARESVVQDSEFLVATDIRTIASNQRGALTLISQASMIRPEWLAEIYPKAVRQSLEHRYDRRQKRVEVFETVRMRDLILSEGKSKSCDPDASGRCLAEAWRDEWLNLPSYDHRLQQFLLRVAALAHHQTALQVPTLDRDLQTTIIARALSGERLGKEAQRKALLPYFRRYLNAETREWLEELYPESMEWVDGKARKLVYQLPRKKEGGQHVEAVLNVSITECFKLESHPTLGDGALPVTLILGVPKGKELARTTDWPHFKQREYPSLKSRWKQKFPGVAWP